MLRIGILGCGPRGMQMGCITKLLPEICILSAMSDPDKTNLQKAAELFPDIALFESSDALLDSGKVDAVITEIPPALHTEYVVKALERNIHVLAEIPAADSIEEGNLLWKKVNSSRAMYMCGSTPNYRSKTLLAKKYRNWAYWARSPMRNPNISTISPAVMMPGDPLTRAAVTAHTHLLLFWN